MKQGRLMRACAEGDLSFVEEYINGGGDPSIKNNKGIFAACNNGHAHIVKRLMEDIRVYDQLQFSFTKCIETSAWMGHSRVVQLLLSYPNINKIELIELLKRIHVRSLEIFKMIAIKLTLDFDISEFPDYARKILEEVSYNDNGYAYKRLQTEFDNNS